MAVPGRSHIMVQKHEAVNVVYDLVAKSKRQFTAGVTSYDEP